MSRLRVLYARPPGRGWDTVTLFARLAADLLEGTLETRVVDRTFGRAHQAAAFAPRRRSGPDCLVVACQPEHLLAVVSADWLLRGHRRVAAYVVDSFWPERIPLLARQGRHLDHLFVTDGELVGTWRERTRTETGFVPFGSDVLGRGSAGAERPVDLQRVGRQPAAWDDDAAVARDAAAHGIAYAGRTPFAEDPVANQDLLQGAMARARLTLSFSNRVSPEGYTHPTREYLTGRWLDALACGAVVAGVAPRCEAAARVLWPEATVEVAPDDRGAGLEALRTAVDAWTPERAALNHHRALERVDWRHRLADIAAPMGWGTPRLDAALADLDAAVAAGGTVRP